MKLHEYQSKQLFAEHGVPIPQGRVATTATEARGWRPHRHQLGNLAGHAQELVPGPHQDVMPQRDHRLDQGRVAQTILTIKTIARARCDLNDSHAVSLLFLRQD